MVKRHLAVQIVAGQGNSVRRVRCFRRFLHQLENAPRAGHGILQLGNHTGDLVKGLRVLIGVGEEAGKLPDGKRRRPAAEAEQRAAQRNAGIDQIVDKARAGIRQRGEEGRLARHTLQAFVDLVEGRHRLVLVGERDNRLVAADHFIDQRRLLRANFGLLLKQRVCPLCDEGCHKQRKRRDQNDPKRDQRMHRKHKAQRAENGQNSGKELGKAHQQPVRDLLRVRNDAADDVADGMTVKVGKRQTLQMGKRVLPKLPHHAEGNAVVKDIHDPLRQGGQPDHNRAAQQESGKRSEIHRVLAEQQVNGVARDHGEIERQHDDGGGKQQRKDKEEAVALEVSEHLAQGREAVGTFHASSPPLYCDS